MTGPARLPLVAPANHPLSAMNVSSSRLRRSFLSSGLLGAAILPASLRATDAPPGVPNSSPSVSSQHVSALAPSEDGLILNFHPLGEINGRANIFRCANPVDIVATRLNGTAPGETDLREAETRMRRLYDMGIRTVVSLQRQEPPTDSLDNPEYGAVILEKTAARNVGLDYVAYPMGNRGNDPLSLQRMSDDKVFTLVETIGDDIVKRSETGGVAFHCKSGKDRTGLVAAYLRIRYQRWTVNDAIAEMRRNGHVWTSFANPGDSSSWHENHLRFIAGKLPPAPAATAP